MKAVAALLLHILTVHYLFVFFLVGLPALALAIALRRKKGYYIPQIFLGIFILSLLGSFIFPPLNVWYLQNHGMKGEAVIVNTLQEPGWFHRTPEVRLTLKIEPDSGPSFMEAVATQPPLEIINRLQVGDKVEVLYAPEYTHDIAITSW